MTKFNFFIMTMITISLIVSIIGLLFTDNKMYHVTTAVYFIGGSIYMELIENKSK
jgi:hypothetical protein